MSMRPPFDDHEGLTVMLMERGNPVAWQLMPQILARVAGFCQKFDTETLPEEAVEIVRTWFAGGDLRLGLWVVYDGGRVIRGHLFATPEPTWSDRPRYVLVRQAEVDGGVDARPESKQVFEAVVAWAKLLGVKTINVLTHRSEVVYMRKWGFEPYKSLMRKEI